MWIKSFSAPLSEQHCTNFRSFAISAIDNNADIPPFNLHPEKWFEGYPVKSTQIFIGCTLIFLGYSLDFFLIYKYETQLFFKLPPWKNSDSTLEKSGCRLNGRESIHKLFSSIAQNFKEFIFRNRELDEEH